MGELIKEFKRDIIRFKPEYWTIESGNGDEFILERGKILYNKTGTEEGNSAVGIIADVKEFIKMPCKGN